MAVRFRRRALLFSLVSALAVAAVVVGVLTTSGTRIPALRGQIVRSGSGNGNSRSFDLGSGLTILSATTSGRGPTYLWLRGSNGAFLPWQLQLTIGETRGSSLDVVQSGTYRLSVATTGPWAVTITQPRPTSGAALPHSFTGSGDEVVGPVELPGYAQFTLAGVSKGQSPSNASITAIAGLTRSDGANCQSDSDDLFTQAGPSYVAVTSYEPGYQWALQVGAAPPFNGVEQLGC
jgi:hypothetical protein